MTHDEWVAQGSPHWQCQDCKTIYVTIPQPDDFTCRPCKFRGHMPEGLAHGKTKILQVNLKDQSLKYPHVIFEYYLEYGDDGAVGIKTFDDDGIHQSWMPVEALLAFADHFRKELGGVAG